MAVQGNSKVYAHTFQDVLEALDNKENNAVVEAILNNPAFPKLTPQEAGELRAKGKASWPASDSENQKVIRDAINKRANAKP